MNDPGRLSVVVPRLMVDATTARVLDAFASAGVRSLVLKGPTLERALYEEGTIRPYGDTDLLVDPADVPRAGQALERLGLRLGLDHRDHPGIAEAHAQEWGPPGGRRTVDLHWRVPGVEIDDASAWAVLVEHAVPFAIGGAVGESLDATGVAFSVALHAAHHGLLTRKPLEDLERALARYDRGRWAAAAVLAARLDATPAFAAGLRLVPRGAAVADALGLGDQVTAERRLHLASPPRGALGLLRLTDARGPRERARIVRETLLPDERFMRAEYPVARRGRRGLVLAHGIRLAVRAKELPRAVLAVRRAHRR